jgi:hypothetical protein
MSLVVHLPLTQNLPWTHAVPTLENPRCPMNLGRLGVREKLRIPQEPEASSDFW